MLFRLMKKEPNKMSKKSNEESLLKMIKEDII